MPSRLNRVYGWNRDPRPAPRDPNLYYHAPPVHKLALPQSVDLRGQYAKFGIPIYDQQAEGSCTANAWAGVVQYLRAVAKLPNQWVPSRQFIYWCERDIEGDTGVDAGAWISSGATVLANRGVCPEAVWPYLSTNMLVRPSQQAVKAAKPHLLTQPQLLDNTRVSVLKSCLAQHLPFVAGFQVFASFESDEVASTGIVPMPTPANGDELLGGHAVCVIGYDDSSKRFICRNSWGKAWGAEGHFTIPYIYFTTGTFSADFHTARGSR